MGFLILGKLYLMEKSKRNEKHLFLIAGALLSMPTVYWFFVGWTPESNSMDVLLKGVQALVGIYLIYYAANKKGKES